MAQGFAFDLDPVSFITVGAIGQPGERTFYLQAAQQSQVVSLVMEKEQALALAAGIEQLFARLQETGVLPADEVQPVRGNMGLLVPVEPAFRVMQMGIGVDEERGLVVLITEERGEDEEGGLRARFTASYAQIAALASQALEIARQGRPTCPLCGETMDDEPHFCPRKNGKPAPPPEVPEA